jgi:hypothetical protein
MNERRMKHLFFSIRGEMFRVESNPIERVTRLVRTTWAEEYAREKKALEARA